MTTTVQRSLGTQNLVAFAGTNKGQTLDPHSFVTVTFDDTGTLGVFGHLYKTNFPNFQFGVACGGSASSFNGPNFTSDATGTADFAFSIQNLPVAARNAVITIWNVNAIGNIWAGNLLYVNGTAINDGTTGFAIPWPPQYSISQPTTTAATPPPTSSGPPPTLMVSGSWGVWGAHVFTM